MQNTEDIHRIHFIGICGTGMASLAAMLKEQGKEVSGSDEGVYPPMSDFLAQKNINVSQGYSVASLQPEPDLVVVGNALSRGNPEIEHNNKWHIEFVRFNAIELPPSSVGRPAPQQQLRPEIDTSLVMAVR